jgi:hypothetical protein
LGYITCSSKGSDSWPTPSHTAFSLAPHATPATSTAAPVPRVALPTPPSAGSAAPGCASDRNGRSCGGHSISASGGRSCSHRLLLRAPPRARLVVRHRPVPARPFSTSRPQPAKRGALLPPPRELVRNVVARVLVHRVPLGVDEADVVASPYLLQQRRRSTGDVQVGPRRSVALDGVGRVHRVEQDSRLGFSDLSSTGSELIIHNLIIIHNGLHYSEKHCCRHRLLLVTWYLHVVPR